jgi:hypothetical protein
MTDYPADAAERALLREQLVREGRQRGEAQAQRRMRSLNCGTRFEMYGAGDGDCGNPCRNDGSSCLCGCHDRVTAEVTR